MAYLIYKNDARQEYVSLENYNVFRIGRTSINEMTIMDDKSVSREHCQIYKEENNNFILRDLESRNGTYLNGVKISNVEVELHAGDRIIIGSAELIFSLSDPQFENTTTTSGISKIELSHAVGQNDEENLVQTAKISKYPDPSEGKRHSKQTLLTSDTLAPGININGYEIIRIIGAGQYSTVYLAFQKSVNRTIAFKVFNKNFRSEQAVNSFLKQIQIIGRLQHPNILPCFDAGVSDDLCYLSMLYVSEGTLANKIVNSFPLEEKYLLSVIKKCAEALNYTIEEHGLIHLDLRPKNILFTDSGEPVITEMGLSSWFSWAYQMNRQNYLGNPSYTSPEQALDQSLDWRADQYTLGIILYECLTGKVPFQADNAYNLISKHKNEEIVFPKQYAISDLVKKIVLKMTAKKAVERYNSWDDLIKDIDSATSGEKTKAPASPTTAGKPFPFKKSQTPLSLKQSSSGSPQKLITIPSFKKKIVPLSIKK